LNRLMAEPRLMESFDLIGLPGGFSYGDAIAAGRIAAQLMRRTLYPSFVHAIERGVPIIAPCNGFQMAVQMGLLPGPAIDESWPDEPPQPRVALANNASARFVDRWCRINIPANTRCAWTQGLEISSTTSLLPVAHGEGRFISESETMLQELEVHGQVALRYAQEDNPNGSAGDVAGICDASGLVFGLMPHPERYTQWTHHPWWTRLNEREMNGEPLGLRIFRNAVDRAKQRVPGTAFVARSDAVSMTT
jgi:phosphoribosylformylglycinamidine synthase subunit PurQ / glutaminase